MIIEYWSDFSCPFCWIAETRLHKALEQLGIDKETRIVFKAFRLNPNAPKEPKRNMVEGFAHHYMMPLEMARDRVESISAMGRSEGLDFNYATARNSSTFDGLRLAKYIQSKNNDLCNQFVVRMYKAFFSENLVLADHAVIKMAGLEMGLTEEEIDSVLNSEAFAEDVLRDEYEARRMGIQAVPFFLINRKSYISGAIDIRDMSRRLMRAYDEEEIESSEAGMVCGPDGCHPAKKE